MLICKYVYSQMSSSPVTIETNPRSSAIMITDLHIEWTLVNVLNVSAFGCLHQGMSVFTSKLYIYIYLSF